MGWLDLDTTFDESEWYDHSNGLRLIKLADSQKGDRSASTV